LFRTTGTTVFSPLLLSYLAQAHMKMGQFHDAHRCISEAILVGETTGERWCEGELHRVAAEITLMSSRIDAPNAEEHLEHALRSRERKRRAHGSCERRRA